MQHASGSTRWSRRRFIGGGAALALGGLLAACIGGDDDEEPAEPTTADATSESSPATSTATASTPTETAASTATETAAATETATLPPEDCSGVLTPSQTEGPFYTEGSPESADLLGDGLGFERLRVEGGQVLLLSGTVYSQDCEPIAGAWIDFWHTDVDGEYDNAGFELRGHQFADGSGRYELRTVMPAEYPGRPRHIHVKVQPPGGAVLTSQVYFPDDPATASDAFFEEGLVMSLRTAADGSFEGGFDFVVETP